MKERWEDLKKNISINPQGNRVRFVPIIPNNINRPNALPPSSSKSLLFKPFIPKHMSNCLSIENHNSTQHNNYEEDKDNLSVVTHMETLHYPSKCSMKNHNSVSLQFSLQPQEGNKLNTLTEPYNMNELKNSLPKLPLRTIWKKDNQTNNFESILPSKNHSLRNPFSPGLHLPSQTTSTTNYVLKSKFQNKAQVLPTSRTTINNASCYKSSYLVPTSPNPKLFPIPENDNTNSSFFTSDNDKLSSTIGENINILEQNSFNFINHPFNLGDIWKDYRCQPPRI